MNSAQHKQQKRTRRQTRIRAKVSGTSDRPRFSVFKSNTALTAQLIDDVAGKTLVAGSTRALKGTGSERARSLGLDLGKKAVAVGIKTVVFDRGGYAYTGNVKAIADGAREGGLTF